MLRTPVVLSAGSLACGPAVAIDDERAPQCEASEPEYALRAEIADARLSALTELATGEVVAAGCLGRDPDHARAQSLVGSQGQALRGPLSRAGDRNA